MGKRTIQDTVQTSKGLRDTLFNEIDALRNGNSNPARARSIALLSSVILNSVRLEIDQHRYVGKIEGDNIPKHQTLEIDL